MNDQQNKHDAAEVVVLGGGAVGTAVAYYLARAGRNVALVELGEFPWGSSKRCDGHAVTYDSPPGYFSRLCKAGLDLFPEVAADLDVDFDFEPEGVGLLIDDERDLETARASIEGKRAEGIEVQFWDRAELRRREPGVADDVLACLNFASDAKLNPMRLAFGLARRAGAYGARLMPRTRVTGIETRDGAVAAVLTDRGRIASPVVIDACGVWAPLIGQMVGLTIPIRPRQGQILVSEKLRGLASQSYAEYGYLAAKGGRTRNGVTADMEAYGVALVTEPTEAGTVLFGSSRRYVGLDTSSHPGVLRAMAQRARRFFPRLAEARIIRCYAGLRPATPDGKPIISPTPVPGFFVAAGHEGNGIGLSLITGKLVAELLGGGPTSVDLAPLRLERFLEPPHAA